MKKRCVLFCLLIVLSLTRNNAQTGSNQLATTVAAMSPGTWAQVPQDATSIFNALQCGGSCGVGGSGNIVGDSTTGAWDPRHHKLYFTGAIHMYPYWTVSYDAATNTWSVICGSDTDPAACGLAAYVPNHGFSRNTVNPINGTQYFQIGGTFAATTLMSRAVGATTFSLAATSPNMYYNAFTPTTFWDGPLQKGDPAGNIVMYHSEEPTNATVSVYHPSTNTFEDFVTLGTGGQSGGGCTVIGNYNAFNAYSETLNGMFFGGGNSCLRRVFFMNAQKTVTRLDDAPMDVPLLGDRGFMTTADPVTGHLIIFGGGVAGDLMPGDAPRKAYDLNPFATAGSQWTAITAPPNMDASGTVTGVCDPVNGVQYCITFPIPEYGVIGVVGCENGTVTNRCTFYVYKSNPGATSFVAKANAAGVVSAYSFDSASATRIKPSSGEPVRYSWASPGPCDTAGLGTLYPIAEPRAPTYGNLFAVDDSGYGGSTCYPGTIDTSTFHSGTGSLHIPYPAVVNASGGYFSTNLQGTDASSTTTWDIDRLLTANPISPALRVQYYYRVHKMQPADFPPASVLGFKSFIGFAEGVSSSESTSIVNVTNTARANAFQDYNHIPDGSLTTPHEESILGTLYVQTGSLCPYSGGGDYTPTACQKLPDDQWIETTTEFGYLPSAYDGVVSGTTLTSASNPFIDSDGHSVGNLAGNMGSVYIVGKGIFPVTAVGGAGSITLASAPGNASGLTVYVSNVNGNAYMRTWRNGLALDNTFDIVRIAWGQVAAGVPTKVGLAQFELTDQSTGASGTAPQGGDTWYDDLIFSTAPILMSSTNVVTDTTPPTPGPPTTVTLSNVGQTSLTVTWTKGTDDTSPQNTLQYAVYKSSSNNLTSLANVLANGTQVVAFMTDIATANVTAGLSCGQTYYFNVLIQDQSNNQAAYAEAGPQTMSACGGVGVGGAKHR